MVWMEVLVTGSRRAWTVGGEILFPSRIVPRGLGPLPRDMLPRDESLRWGSSGM